MNRVRLGVAILLTLVLCSCGTAWLVRSETSRLLKQLDQLRETALQSPEQASRHSSSSTTSGKSPNAASIWWCGGTGWCRST
ncbi:MAG: hypothetical protein ACLTXT_01705 [Ruminococcus callidus]